MAEVGNSEIPKALQKPSTDTPPTVSSTPVIESLSPTNSPVSWIKAVSEIITSWKGNKPNLDKSIKHSLPTPHYVSPIETKKPSEEDQKKP